MQKILDKFYQVEIIIIDKLNDNKFYKFTEKIFFESDLELWANELLEWLKEKKLINIEENEWKIKFKEDFEIKNNEIEIMYIIHKIKNEN